MRCGAKCFLVEFEINGVRNTVAVRARTAASARKAVRIEHGNSVHILTALEKKGNI